MLLTLDDGVVIDLKSITDGSGLDSNGASGVITFIGAVGSNWTINVTTGIVCPNSGTDARIELNSVDVSAGRSRPHDLAV